MENAYVEQFLSECYEKETKAYIQMVMVDITAHIEEIREELFVELDVFFLELAEKQKTKPESIAYINMSFLYTSVYFGKPTFRLDAYGDLGYLGECFASTSIDGKWLYTRWDEYRERLRSYLKKNGMERHVREERLNQILIKSIKTLTYQGMVILKYILSACNEGMNYTKFTKDETFRLTYGEYRDWQRNMFVDKPEIDLLKSEAEVPRTFQKYKDVEFKQEELRNINCNNSKFVGCRFIDTKFEMLKMNDCVFKDCVFEMVEMLNMEFYGTTFYNCKIRGMKGESLSFGLSNNENPKDIYKTAEFISCEFQNVQIKDSDTSEIQFENCDGGQGSELINCNRAGSNFEWVQKEKG